MDQQQSDFHMKGRTRMKATAVKRISIRDNFTDNSPYQTHVYSAYLLVSHSSPLGTILLLLPQYHDPKLSILLLVSQPLLSILLLVERKEPRFYKASCFLTNSQNSDFNSLPTIEPSKTGTG
jgi:hypothetical protein